jgi:DNA-binding CsgD family transcriptional regulator
MTVRKTLGPSPVGGGPAVSLTDHELRVLSLVAQGLTHEQIARRLIMTSKGVTPTVNRAVKKLGARNAPHAVLLACRAGLLDGRPRRPQRHGDRAGFVAHVRRGEEPCPACWEGKRAYDRSWRQARKTNQSHAA